MIILDMCVEVGRLPDQVEHGVASKKRDVDAAFSSRGGLRAANAMWRGGLTRRVSLNPGIKIFPLDGRISGQAA